LIAFIGDIGSVNKSENSSLTNSQNSKLLEIEEYKADEQVEE
jgi:hypothetical protein